MILFLMGMIDQVDITSSRSFEMIPKIGNQLIVFGDAADVKEKFDKLKLFYKNVISQTGWNHYSVINLQYKGQVVGKIRGADDVSADSLRTVQLMQLIALNAEIKASDSLKTFTQDSEKNTADSSMILQSIQRDETVGAPLTVSIQPEVASPEAKNVTTVEVIKTKSTVTKAVLPKKIKMIKPKPLLPKPKAVYKASKNNDY